MEIEGKGRHKIVFVCAGNTCRSPMAQILFQEAIGEDPVFAKYTIQSAGLFASGGQSISSALGELLTEANPKERKCLQAHRSAVLTQAVVDDSIAIICATKKQEEILKKTFANLPKVCKSFSDFGGDIEDPFGGDMDAYRKTFNEILKKIPLIVEFLRKVINDH